MLRDTSRICCHEGLLPVHAESVMEVSSPVVDEVKQTLSVIDQVIDDINTSNPLGNSLEDLLARDLKTICTEFGLSVKGKKSMLKKLIIEYAENKNSAPNNKQSETVQ
jgi:hypothetical protein